MESFIHGEDLQTFRNTWKDASEGKEIRQKIRCKNAQGDTLWLIASLSAVKDKDDALSKIIFIGLDHTESENEKQALRKKLENQG